jgi:dsDNA-specific endonuclease/ATPase MutS2
VQKQVKIGDSVSIIDDTVKGKVLEVNGDTILIEDKDGFERSYSIDEIVIYNTQVSLDEINFKKNVAKDKLAGKVKSRYENDIIDLHNKNTFLKKNQILENQIKLFKRYLNLAIGKKQDQIVFIHGKGEGVLRTALIKILNKNSIKYEKAPYHKFGQGAIKIYLTGIHKVIR